MADFFAAVAKTFVNEGGFQISPNDSGNWTGGKIGVGELKGTKWGISAAIFPNLDIENLSQVDAEAIYREKYWNFAYNSITDQSIAEKMFDLGVLFGPVTSIEKMQEALKSTWPVVVDGKMGPQTLNQINNSEPKSLLLAFKTIMVSRAVAIGAAQPAKRPSVAGWIRRINS